MKLVGAELAPPAPCDEEGCSPVQSKSGAGNPGPYKGSRDKAAGENAP